MAKITNRYKTDDQRLSAKSVRKLLRRALKRVIDLVRENSSKEAVTAEKVHQLRSETRRADATLRLLNNWLPHQRAKSLQKQLGTIRDRASDVRDLDVSTPLINSLIISAAVAEWLNDRVTALRYDGRRSLRHLCKTLLDDDFAQNCHSLTSRIGWRANSKRPTGHEVCDGVSVILIELNEALDATKRDSSQYHRVRILGRRLRYTLENLQRLIPDLSVESTCQSLSQLQDQLGDVHDRELAHRFLIEQLAECSEPSIRDTLSGATADFERETSQQLAAVLDVLPDEVARIREELDALVPQQPPKSSAGMF